MGLDGGCIGNSMVETSRIVNLFSGMCSIASLTEMDKYVLVSHLFDLKVLVIIEFLTLTPHVAISFNCSHCFTDMYCSFVHIMNFCYIYSYISYTIL